MKMKESEARKYCKKFGLNRRELYDADPRYIARALAKAYEAGNKPTKTKKHSYRSCGASAHYDRSVYCYMCGGKL